MYLNHSFIPLCNLFLWWEGRVSILLLHRHIIIAFPFSLVHSLFSSLPSQWVRKYYSCFVANNTKVAKSYFGEHTCWYENIHVSVQCETFDEKGYKRAESKMETHPFCVKLGAAGPWRQCRFSDSWVPQYSWWVCPPLGRVQEAACPFGKIIWYEVSGVTLK